MQTLPTIRDAVDQFCTGALTPTDLLEHCLGRIRLLEDRIRAWVLVDKQGARREAARLTELAARGEIVGPLHGIPIGVKDIIDVAGMPTKCGSPLLEDSPPAEKDAFVVARLRSAGAIILGKTVTTEWACFDPPPTRNPWNFGRTPGGSSSGSAAAVAMEMCMAALGTQTGGSIIRPAAYCGVCGLKPTIGRIDMTGIAPVSAQLDHVGPMARNIGDLQSVFDVLAGSDDATQGSDQQRTSIALCEEYFLAESNADVRECIRNIFHSLPAEAKAKSPSLPVSFSRVHENHWRVMAVDAAEVHRESFAQSREKFGRTVALLLDEGAAMHKSDYDAALKHQREFRRDLEPTFAETRHWMMPSTPAVAPGPETTGDAKFNVPWSYAGYPSITLPCGLNEDGLPIGLQLVAPPMDEADLLATAAWVEKHVAFDSRPPTPVESDSPDH